MEQTASKDESLSTSLAAASALEVPASGKQIARLARDIDVAIEPKPCMECGRLTTGSVGAAGFHWPRLCQSCKDAADGELSSRIAQHGSVGRALIAGLESRINSGADGLRCEPHGTRAGSTAASAPASYSGALVAQDFAGISIPADAKHANPKESC